MIIFVKNTIMENNKSVSSVEWLVNQLIKEGKLFYDDYKCIEQAKEMEKQQIIDFGNDLLEVNKINWDARSITAEQYYNQTFNK
jgi:hypothetical protein